MACNAQLVILAALAKVAKLCIDIYGQIEYANTVLDVMIGGKNYRTTKWDRDCNKQVFELDRYTKTDSRKVDQAH